MLQDFQVCLTNLGHYISIQNLKRRKNLNGEKFKLNYSAALTSCDLHGHLVGYCDKNDISPESPNYAAILLNMSILFVLFE